MSVKATTTVSTSPASISARSWSTVSAGGFAMPPSYRISRVTARRSHESGEPAPAVLDAAVLDVEELGTDRLGVAVDVALAPVVDRSPRPAQLADRRDDGGGAAREDLEDLAAGSPLLPLLDRDAPLLGLEALLLGDLEDRAAGDALEDRPR